MVNKEKLMISKILYKLKTEGLIKLLISMIRYPFKYKKRRLYQRMLKQKNSADRFTYIYKNNLWSSSESLSGSGSEIAYTEPLRKWLTKNLPKFDIKNFIDAPCGDFNWMHSVVKKLNLSYLGIDIVSEVIKSNDQLYSEKLINFKVGDICQDPVPPCDLIMVRDCLFHLSFKDIEKFLINLNKTNYKYLLTSNHIVRKGFANKDIITGDFRLIDLYNTPFNFDRKLVIENIVDSPEGYEYPREMIFIKKADVPTILNFEN